MVQNRIVARYKDGQVLKGHTNDFLPNRPFFHLSLIESPNTKPVTVQIEDLKAVFIVKDFQGDPHRKDNKDFDNTKPVLGRKIRIRFRDGEELIGTTQGYSPGRQVFFLTPADPQSNIERCLIVASATSEITPL